MNRFSRLYARSLSYLLLAIFLLQLAAVSPISALSLPETANSRPGYRTQLQVEPALTLTAISSADSIIIGETNEVLLNINNEGVSALTNVQLHVPYHPNVRFMDDNGQELESHIMELDELSGNSKRSMPFMLQVLGDAPELIKLEFMVRAVEVDSVKTTLTLVIDTSSDPEIDPMAAPSPESVTVDPESAWTLAYTPPGASEFTGAAQFSYPISVVPGAGGLTPGLTLHYNSGGLDNVRPFVMSNSFGEGWSLPQAQIVNGNAPRLYDGDGYSGCCHNFETTRFTLELNGVSYRLKPITSGRHGRYIALGDPSLYIEFIDGVSDSTLANVTGEYWLVRTADGTSYRFGFNEDAEQVIAPVSTNTNYNDSQPRNDLYMAYSWKLDTITNSSGVNIAYTYQTKCGAVRDNTSLCRNIPNGAYDTEADVALDKILYNFNVTTGYKTVIDFDYNFKNHTAVEEEEFMIAGYFQPSKITVIHDGQTIKSYTFSYEEHGHFTGDANPWTSSFWMLTSIREFGSNGTTSLPATTFTYDQPADKSCANDTGGTQHCIGLLTKVENGYGAVTKLFYEEVGDRYFRVADVYTWDGVAHVYNGVNGTAATHIAHDRTNASPCYDKDGYGCRSPFTASGSGALVGFDQVTVKVYDPSNPQIPLSEVRKTFNTTNYWLNGKLLTSSIYDPASQVLLSQETNDWEVESTATYQFSRLDRTTSLVYAPSGIYSGVEERYTYNSGDQGNAQWGRVTRQETFSVGGEGDESPTYQLKGFSATRYVANASSNVWIIAPWVSKEYDENSAMVARTFYLYDNALDPDNQTLSLGRLTLTRVQHNFTDIDPGSTTTYETADTQYGYDSYGNVQSIITYEDYGQLGYASSSSGWTYWTTPGNGSPSRISSATYDSDGMHPIRTTNPLNHTTIIDYDSTFPWLPWKITDVNDLVTEYRYDVFGRLTTIIGPGQTASNPTMSYTYSLVDPPDANINKVLQIDEITFPNDPALRSTNRRFYDGLGRVVQERKFDVQIDNSTNTVIWQETHYDALGRPTCQIHPGGTSTTQFYLHDCASYANTTTSYDALGRPSLTTAPDGSQTATIYGLLSTYSYNAKNQLQAAFTDSFGRLKAVDETLATYSNPLDESGDLNAWTTYGGGTVSVANNYVTVTYPGTPVWTGMYRPVNIAGETNPEKGVTFSFRPSNSGGQIQMYLASGAWDTDDFRYWGLEMNLGNLRLLEWEGDGSIANRTITELMPANAGVWYDAVLRTSQDSGNYFILAVWERENPAVSAEIRVPKDASWQLNNWVFDAKTSNSSFDFDNYRELTFNRTFYGYDVLDNLANVTDALGNVTTIEYDALGRKTGMDDPDMGEWSYEYDPAGNLVEQTDANGNILCFTYDELNRIRTKEIGSSPCPGSNILASYGYDYVTNGIGRLRSVRWGPDRTQNYDTFSYDALGRMYKQERLINGRPYTMETLSFDALNRPLQVQYPNGEIITMEYDHEGENTLTAGSDLLVTDVRYNAMGQLEYIDRVHSWNLDTDFEYYGASGNFRLEKIINGTVRDNESVGDNRPDFTYQYDSVGNITNMLTDTGGNGVDTQEFTYDSLNRLVSAYAIGGVANYDYDYQYDAIGNILARVDNLNSANNLTYNYDSTQPHAVDSITTTGDPYSFSYDNNGNMTSRVDESGSYSQLFDVENRLTVVNKNGGGVTTFYYDASGQRVKSIEPDGTIIYTPFPGYEETISSEGYHWTFDEGSGSTANDSSFNNYDGTLQGPQWTGGYYGQALDFDGSNDWVAFDGTIDVVGGLTVSAWVRPEELPTGLGHLVMSTYKWSSDSTKRRGWYLGDNYGDTDHFTFGVHDDNGNLGQVIYDGFFNQYLNQWVHVTGVFRPGESVELYINGQLVESDTTNVPSQIGQSNLFRIGSRADNTTQGHWDGQIDEVRVMPRALAASEISGLMAANLPASTGGTVLADAGSSLGSTVLAANENGGEAANLFALVLLGSVLFVIPVVQLWKTPKYRTRLRLTWRRHRVTVGKIVSMVSLMGLLVNSVFLVPIVQAAPAAAPPLGPVQSPWVSADIGSVGVAGSADETSGTFTIDGAGANIASTVDAFHFVYQSLTGDGSITANAVSLSGGGSMPRMGLMMRNSLADDAAHVAAVVQGNRIRVLDRASSGGSTTEVAGHTQGAPEWLRIERSGNTFTLSRSNDGSSWSVMQTRTITMGTTIYVGMAVTGNSTTTLATGVFDNVSVTGSGGATATPTATSTATPTATVPGPTATATSTATATPSPTPSPTPPPAQPEVIVQRTTYSIAGQAVFLRIRTLEDEVEVDNRLYAMHTDHLGSTSTLSYLDPVAGTAYQLQDARALYEPFGDYRVEPTGEYTDRGYTGHLGNNSGSNDIGLIYMNARYYVSGIARFASADTIVPDPSDPQGFNRYSYVKNRPISFNDPSGHIGCQALGTEECVTDSDGNITDDYVDPSADLTSWLVSEMVSHAEAPELSLMRQIINNRKYHLPTNGPSFWGYFESAMFVSQVAGPFYQLNKGFGRWDVKRNILWQIGPAVTLCGTNSCGWFDYSTPGNILYGFTAASVGIPLEISQLAGGALEIKEGTVNWANWQTTFEDPQDLAAVQFGYYLFDTYGPDITVSEFQEAFTVDVQAQLQGPPSGFIPRNPAEAGQEEYAVGYFDYVKE